MLTLRGCKPDNPFVALCPPNIHISHDHRTQYAYKQFMQRCDHAHWRASLQQNLTFLARNCRSSLYRSLVSMPPPRSHSSQPSLDGTEESDTRRKLRVSVGNLSFKTEYITYLGNVSLEHFMTGCVGSHHRAYSTIAFPLDCEGRSIPTTSLLTGSRRESSTAQCPD